MKSESRGLRPGIVMLKAPGWSHGQPRLRQTGLDAGPGPGAFPQPDTQEQISKACLQRPELIPLFEVPNAKAELPKLWPIVSVYIYHAKAFTQSTTLRVSSFEENVTSAHLRPIIILHPTSPGRPWTVPPPVAWLFEKIFLWEVDNEKAKWKRDIITIPFSVKHQNWCNKITNPKWLTSNLNKNNRILI